MFAWFRADKGRIVSAVFGVTLPSAASFCPLSGAASFLPMFWRVALVRLNVPGLLLVLSSLNVLGVTWIPYRRGMAVACRL